MPLPTGPRLTVLDDRSYDAPIRLMDAFIGYDDQHNPMQHNSSDPDHLGRALLVEGSPMPPWRAESRRKDLDRLWGLYPFDFGAMVSPRIREVIERVSTVGIEFIPLEVYHAKTGVVLGDWWFMNVFNWRQVFDLDRSDVEWRELSGNNPLPMPLQRMFGNRYIRYITRLTALPEAWEGGFYRAAIPQTVTSAKVFLGREMIEALEAARPGIADTFFRSFFLEYFVKAPAVQPVSPERLAAFERRMKEREGNG